MEPSHKHEAGQALTEFVFLLPILLLVLLATVQIIVVADRHQRTQMATWFAMRSQTYDSSHSFVNRSQVQRELERDMFGNDDQVKVTGGGFPLYEAKVECAAPYLLKNVRWAALQSVFSQIESGGKIRVASKNKMLKDPVPWW